LFPAGAFLWRESMINPPRLLFAHSLAGITREPRSK
jgi:hypothetical protein